MSVKCTQLARFTNAGEHYDRWYCSGCRAILFLPHGDPAPDEHIAGEMVLPDDTSKLPTPPLTPLALIAAGATFPQDPNTVRDVRNLAQKAPLPIEIYTRSLPSDMLIVKKDK